MISSHRGKKKNEKKKNEDSLDLNRETRTRLIEQLDLLKDKLLKNPVKKHGSIPL